MTPIRVGFIGLSASSWAGRAHIYYLLASPKFEIVALANSTVESAKSAIKAHSLSPSTKAYGTGEELAADPDVDLVVCSVNVALHYPLIKPALEQGKMAFVEWPLGRNLQEAQELADLARKSGVKTMVGLQGRKSILIAKIKQLVDDGRIGRVLSSTVVATLENFGTGTEVPLGMRYFLDKSQGGNNVTIYFGHCESLFQTIATR